MRLWSRIACVLFIGDNTRLTDAFLSLSTWSPVFNLLVRCLSSGGRFCHSYFTAVFSWSDVLIVARTESPRF